jgi:hypothetical protein
MMSREARGRVPRRGPRIRSGDLRARIAAQGPLRRNLFVDLPDADAREIFSIHLAERELKPADFGSTPGRGRQWFLRRPRR